MSKVIYFCLYGKVIYTLTFTFNIDEIILFPPLWQSNLYLDIHHNQINFYLVFTLGKVIYTLIFTYKVIFTPGIHIQHG